MGTENLPTLIGANHLRKWREISAGNESEKLAREARIGTGRLYFSALVGNNACVDYTLEDRSESVHFSFSTALSSF